VKAFAARLLLAVLTLPTVIFSARTAFLGAVALVCTGVSFFSVPCALIVGGALLIVDFRT
jgi:hypothetical protein